ncbi:hypothetical protein CAP35_07580 [Chitinophagaceae bacterium IBVUCB1]|nr:hypothetical protein CAP35_07580 [Chitinophagaceae bacterium IBVUCB1]
MKPVVIILFIAVTVGVSAYYFDKRISTQTDEIDVIERSLAGTSAFIHANSTIEFAGQKDMVQLFSIARYALAPALIKPYTTGSDTLLAIQKKEQNDSLVNTLTTSRQIIWQTNDSLYTYTLSVTR